MRDFVFVFLVCRGLRLFLGCVWWWVGVSHLGFSLPPADGVPAPPPQEKEQSAGSGNQGDSAPMGAGDLARNPAWARLPLGARLVLGTRQAVTTVGRAGPDSPGQAGVLVSTMYKVLCVWCCRRASARLSELYVPV